MGAFEFKYRITLGLVALCVILAPIWIYFERHSILQTISPFRTLENKIVVDGIDIIDWTSDGDINEIYLIDTVSHAIRQLTDDTFRDRSPVISFEENRIYFLSNRPSGRDQEYADLNQGLYYFDIASQEIHSAYGEFGNILRSPNSEIRDITISEGRMAIVESYDSVRLYIVDLRDNRIIKQLNVHPNTIIVGWEDGSLSTKENGVLESYEVGNE